MLPLSELVALIQFEVQKSFEFSEQLMFDLSGSQASVLQLAVDVVELDLPVRFSMGTIPTVVAAQPKAIKANLVLQQLDAPFLGRLTADALRKGATEQSPAGAAKKSPATKLPTPKLSQQLLVEIGGDTPLTSEAKAPQPMGRLRLVLKPVLK